ncbi:MAG: hypothetical protein K8S16_08390, partial [Bacteroidales bacterium]|nr:hypothetical protein [Bacteroidales bacterium]
MQKLKILFRYISYLQQAKSKFDIHPPFLFDLVTNVFEDSTSYPAYNRVENMKKELLKTKDTIHVHDFGAGSTLKNGNLRSIAGITKNSSKPAKYGRLLYRLSRYFSPSNILELGTSVGLSSCYLALGNPGSKVITIEGCQNISQIAKDNFKEIGIQNIDLITGNFENVLPGVLDSIPQ